MVLNADSNTLETPFDDVQALPPDVVSAPASHPLLPETQPSSGPNSGSLCRQVSLLRLRLRKAALSPGEGVSRLFLRAQALLFGGYREALVCTPVSRRGDAQGILGKS